MLPLQPYHEGSYPPGPKFPQFGDDAIGGYLNAHAALAEKRRNMVPYHIGRLAQDGFVPLNALPSQVPASPHNPKTRRRKPSTTLIHHHRLPQNQSSKTPRVITNSQNCIGRIPQQAVLETPS